MSNKNVHDRLLRDYVLNDFDVMYVLSEQCVHVSFGKTDALQSHKLEKFDISLAIEAVRRQLSVMLLLQKQTISQVDVSRHFSTLVTSNQQVEISSNSYWLTQLSISSHHTPKF